MSLLQSLWATGQRNTPNGDCAGDEVSQVFEFTMPATALAAGDIIELAVLPATHTPTDAILVSEALDTLAVDIGIMSGEVGDKDPARTCGKEIFAAQAVDGTAAVRTELVSAFTIQPTDNHRSIGAKVTTAPGASIAGKKLRLLLKYVPA
jgi:hypothetical protein